MSSHQSRPQTRTPNPSWFELFYDLIVVAIVAQVAKVFLSAPSWAMTGLILSTVLTLFTVWLLVTLSHSVIPADDPIRRAILLGQMILLAVAALALGKDGLPGWIGFAAMSGALLAMTAVFVRNARQSEALRRLVNTMAISTSAGAAVFALGMFASLALGDAESFPLASMLILLGCLVTALPVIGPTLRELLDRSALDLAHLEERCALFVIIVLGESFVGLLLSLGRIGSIPNPGIFVLTFVIAFAIWAVYFNSVLPSRMPTSVAGLRGWILGHALLLTSTVAFAVQFTDLTMSPDPAQGLLDNGRWTPLPLLGIAVALAALALIAQDVAKSLRNVQLAACLVLGLLFVADLIISPSEIGISGNIFTTMGAFVLIGDSVACEVIRARMGRGTEVEKVGHG